MVGTKKVFLPAEHNEDLSPLLLGHGRLREPQILNHNHDFKTVKKSKMKHPKEREWEMETGMQVGQVKKGSGERSEQLTIC